MNNNQFPFWKMAYEAKWATIDQMRMVVYTESNRYGVITVEQFEEITGEPFDPTK